MKNKIVHTGIIAIFCSLYFLVATISMINSVAFFNLSHEGFMSWSLAIGFELGAAASLGAIIILEKTNRAMVWGLFLLLTSFQMMANSFHAYINLEEYMGWIELFGLQEEEPLFQKRVLSIISGAVLPLVALGFIKSLVDYIRPEKKKDMNKEELNDSDEDWDEDDEDWDEDQMVKDLDDGDVELDEQIDLAVKMIHESDDEIEKPTVGNVTVDPKQVKSKDTTRIAQRNSDDKNVDSSAIKPRY